MLAIQPMTPLDARRDWGWIRNGLLEIIGRCKERYLPEDVWQAVMAGSAFVWRVETAHDEIGFLILRKDQDPDGPALFVWCCWCEPGSLAKHGADLMERLKEVGHRIGAKRIRFESSRKGWALFEHFEERSVIYEREL